MEVKVTRHRVLRNRLSCMGLFFLLILTLNLCAQPAAGYTIKDGRMYIGVPRNMKESALNDFIAQYDLKELQLKEFIKTNDPKKLQQLGWKVELNNKEGFVISKEFEPLGSSNHLPDRILFSDKNRAMFPAVNNGVSYGVNRFQNKQPFGLHDSLVTFFLRNAKNAKDVKLAGSFNNWSPETLSMKRTDSGWIANVKLGPGKYWYKFIIDGNWTKDNDNLLSENDGEGNVNSVFYRTNVSFKLSGFANAKKVFLSGSFNNWKPNGLAMNRTATGWELPLYLPMGTHTYKFVVDGQWHADENNPEKLPDGNGGYNSVWRLGKPHRFSLNGFQNAKQVIVAGSFNGRKEDELFLRKTAGGWELPYVLGAGNYEYKFKVDGKWITDPGNAMRSNTSGNSYLVIEPNHVFRLKGYANAKKVFLAGEFNNWDPGAYAMKKEGDTWVFSVHLSVGKHLYKFLVDDQWIIDPANKLWEQNGYSTGNSVIWIEE
jgi:hypothetical protein